MKYRDISWNLCINGEQASFDDDALDFIAEQIQHGNTSGLFTSDCTKYNEFDNLKEKLENEIGRTAYFDYENKGELDELLKIAKANNDYKVVDIIEKIFEVGFDD